MTMYTFYKDAEQKKLEESLKIYSKEEIISLQQTVQSEIDKWKDEPYWYIDPAHIPIVPNYTVDCSPEKPKTRFEMIIEKK